MTVPRCTLPPADAAAAAAARHAAAVPRLRTARTVLRAPRIEDLPLWTALLSGPDAVHLGGLADTRTAWGSFCVYAAGWLLHGHGLWALERRADGALLGFVLIGLEWGDAEPELGWALAPEARGQGYGLEAAVAARDHALALLGAGGAVSYIDPTNAASARLAARLGARRDAAAEARRGDGTEVWRHGTAA